MIQVEHLTKRYGGHTAVDDISFTVEDGCIYGLLGPNGAGKSTTMNIITGYLSATDGTVTINGHDIAEEPAAAKACIGYLPEQPPLYQDMTVREYLLFVAELKGTRKKADRIAAVLVGVLCKSLPVGLGVFGAGAVVLVVLFQLRPAWLLSAFNAVLGALALFQPFNGVVGGMFSVSAIVYYLSVIALFLFLTGQSLERRRWH